MQWAIVANEPLILGRFVTQTTEVEIAPGVFMLFSDTQWIESEVPANTIMNLIEYDGHSPYTPPDPRTRLEEVADGLQIGDVIE